jgi:hypothetical protein
MTRRLLSHRKLMTVATAGIIAVGLGACSSSGSSHPGSSGSG